MKPFLLLLLAFLIQLSISQSSYCSRSFTPLYSSCTFYYFFSDPSCQNFQLSECTWEECVEQTTINNQTSCTKYQTRYDTSWDYCTSRCCLKSYPYVYESLQQCEDDLKSLYATIILVVLIVVGVVILIVVLVFVVKYLRGRSNMERCKQNCFNLLTCLCLRAMARSGKHLLADEREPAKVQHRSDEHQQAGLGGKLITDLVA